MKYRFDARINVRAPGYCEGATANDARDDRLTIEDLAYMRLRERQGPEMETERVGYQTHTLPTLSAVGTERTTRRPLPPLDAINTSSLGLDEYAWCALLEATRHQRPARLMYCFIFKRWLDVLLASLLIVLFAPLLLLVTLISWLDTRGSVIYRQRRIGRYGKPFTMYKFRTMIPDRRQTTHRYSGPERRKAHKTISDPRVTRTGKIMRRTSIDELPQLFNVLRGEMSLVGPRPELPEIVSTYESWQRQRHLVLPGITGWWQTHGRSSLMMHDHTALDIYYVQHISFAMDMRILLATFRAITVRSGAF
jgi:lipopolysaccharide/colanic/teichoic acid biosynthesis glycosyltransferase